MGSRKPGYRQHMTSSTPTPRPRPRGREQIQAALIESTLDLLETRGLEISIRQIADRADVPHSVIGRYFGSKDELIRSAIDSTLPADRAVADAFETPEQAATATFESAFERPERVRTLVQLLQAGMTPREIRSEAPMLESLAKLLGERPETDVDPRVLAAAIMAFSMGWLLTEEFVVDHTDLDVLDRDEVRAQVLSLLLRLI